VDLTPADLDAWMPIRLHASEEGLTVDWCRVGAIDFSDPFFDQTVERVFRHPFPLLFRHQTTVSEAQELVAGRTGLPVAGFVFHVSRCGSTLVTKVLGASERVLVLAEPGPLDTVLRHTIGQPIEDRAEQFATIVHALAQRRRPGHQACVIKLDAWAVLELPVIRHAFPDVPWVFLHRDPVEVLVSQAGHRGFPMLPGMLPTALFEPFADRHQPPDDPDEYSAFVIGALLLAARRHLDDGALVLGYPELPAAILSRIAPHFGLAYTTDERAAVELITARHAKNEVLPFDAADDAHRARGNADPDIEAASVRWADEPWQALLRAVEPTSSIQGGGEAGPSGRGDAEVLPAGTDLPDRLRLPLTFEATALAAEALALDEDLWEPHFNESYYAGDWSGIALRRTVGAPVELYPDPTRDEWEDTPALDACPAIRAALATFACPLQTVRLLRLGPGSTIEEHRDHALGVAHGEVRLHIPLVTADDVTFWLDGRPVPMRAGECWYLDLTEVHRVHNDGQHPRVHLVIDCRVNAWLQDLLRAGATAAR
jgi:hypothetical protein